MTALSIQPTYPIFTDIDGQPLEDGYVWIGTANLDPQTNPINVYWDAALTLPAAQPIRTLAGYPANSGTPARLYVNSDYSIRVMNKNGSTVYSAPAATERFSSVVIDINSNDVSFTQAGTGAITRSSQDKMREIVSVTDFPDLDTAVAAVSDGDSIYIPDGVICGPLSGKLTKGIKFIGAKKPIVKSNLTGLEKGSIIRGPLIYDANNCEFHNLGVDSGSAVCNTYYSGTAQEGLICTVTYATSNHYGLRVKNVVCITKDRNAPVHSFAAERQIDADIDGVETCFGIHGQAYKTINSNISNLIANRSGGEGVIIKRDELSACYNSNFNNVVVNCYDGGNRGNYGVVFESRRGDDGVTPGNLYGINLNNFTVKGANYHGVMLQGATTSSDLVNDINVTNGVIEDCLLDGVRLTGKTLRCTFVNVQAKACGEFGFTDYGAQSDTTKFIGCFAGNCVSGFVGFGLRFQVIGCESSGNTNWGYYAKNGSSSYRGENRGRLNGTSLYGNDPLTYWFEIGMPYQSMIYTPTLLGAWVNYDPTQTTWQGARYWIGSDGMVHLSGVIKDGVLNTDAFQLPLGFTPSTYKRFVGSALSSTIVNDIYIAPGGEVRPVAGTNTFVCLDGISFLPNRSD